MASRVWLGIVLVMGLQRAAGAQDADALRVEATQRNDALVKQGFNYTRRVALGATPTHLEVVVPTSDGDEEHVVSLWFATTHGALAVRFVGPKGEVIASWNARSGEQRLVRVLASGTYVIDVTGAVGQGVVGVKGGVIPQCTLEAGRVTEHAADPAHGFFWPYLLVTPKPGSKSTLLVLANNTGLVTEDLDVIRASAMCDVARQLALVDRLGTPALVPLFPRPKAPGAEGNLYLHALTRASLLAKPAAVARVDLQLIAMIDHARAHTSIGSRVLMVGFSASAMFTNRFAFLHPDRVLAAAVDSPGGWPIAPVASDHGESLTYPVGVSDLAALAHVTFDLAALRRVPLLFVMGGDDGNDAVPHRDSFSADDEALVMRLYGKTPLERWDAARRLYDTAKLHARFQLYPNVGHELTAAMLADIAAMFETALQP